MPFQWPFLQASCLLCNTRGFIPVHESTENLRVTHFKSSKKAIRKNWLEPPSSSNTCTFKSDNLCTYRTTESRQTAPLDTHFIFSQHKRWYSPSFYSCNSLRQRNSPPGKLKTTQTQHKKKYFRKVALLPDLRDTIYCALEICKGKTLLWLQPKILRKAGIHIYTI